MNGNGRATLRDFLETALIPCGHTLYVWGGGWNEEDTGAGEDAVTIGESPQWRRFFEESAAGYDYRQHRYSFGDGLDCSGFIGWALYNTLETGSGRVGYVTKSTGMAQSLAERGFGHCLPRTPGCICLPGDIVSMPGHVYLSLGTCEDGSVVLLHSSPQAGVQISGTCLAKGKGESLAFMAADAAMKEHFPECHALFGTRQCGEEYLSGTLFRWSFPEGPLADPEGLSGMSPAALLETLHYARGPFPTGCEK